jgi:hypothetical protein
MTRRLRFTPALALVVAASLGTQAQAANITILNVVDFDGYRFTNFDGPVPGTTANTGTNNNGIANNGTITGFSTPDGTAFTNFTANPLTSTTANVLNINGSTSAMAFGVNSAGTVVGTDGNGNAFFLPNGGAPTTFIPNGGASAMAFGINDKGAIVGTYTTAAGPMPGFLLNNNAVTQINAPTGNNSNSVNAQGINNNGLIVGFYLGNDGQVHGFMANASNAVNNMLTGTAIADPIIKPVEPGATFVFSQVLGDNDQGIAVGYYGDSTTSQHGYFYDTNTGKYTFLDNPDAAFNNGVEITQITGINNSGEITGFYSDANGVFHGFIAVAIPEPSSMALLGIGVSSFAIWARRRGRLTSLRGHAA